MSTQPERLAALALAAIRREYPSQIAHRLENDADARPPRELTPAFFGSFDWHSAVHGHWCLARLLRCHPGRAFEVEARDALAASLAAQRIAGEVRYLGRPGREGFERPYGLAWLLQLAAELREWEDSQARAMAGALAPLETLAAERIVAWLPKLPWPIRGGEHSQTAFALGLVHDWARVTDRGEARRLVEARSLAFYRADVAAPIAYEPSGHDFLSPALAEADLMRRVLSSGDFPGWLSGFLPDLQGEAARRWLAPVESPDPSDGKLAHLDGLNLSRGWMLEGIASALGADDPRQATLADAAARHLEAGLAATGAEHYEGAHWLASFAAYAVTRRGIVPQGSGSALAGER